MTRVTKNTIDCASQWSLMTLETGVAFAPIVDGLDVEGLMAVVLDMTAGRGQVHRIQDFEALHKTWRRENILEATVLSAYC